jgi:DNA-binding GntR family transcriptional regulator
MANRQVSRHQQLAETLLGQIVDGTLAVGDRIPTEAELCTAHGLARGTVRQALDQLERLGMITRQPKVGTVVVADRPVGAYQPVAQSAADIATLAADTRLLRPKSADVVTDAAMARRIGTRPGTEWFALWGVRIRRGDPSTPLCWSEHFLRADLPREKLLYAKFTVEEVAAHNVTQTISASLLEVHVADALDAKSGSPALVITRRHRDRKGRLISAGIHIHPADRFEITGTL